MDASPGSVAKQREEDKPQQREGDEKEGEDADKDSTLVFRRTTLLQGAALRSAEEKIPENLEAFEALFISELLLLHRLGAVIQITASPAASRETNCDDADNVRLPP